MQSIQFSSREGSIKKMFTFFWVLKKKEYNKNNHNNNNNNVKQTEEELIRINVIYNRLVSSDDEGENGR